MVDQVTSLTSAASLAPYVRLMRPQQWTKNVIVLAGVVFSGQATQREPLFNALLALLAFCLASSAVYVFNDWHDRAEDRHHPTKRWRPIAARQVSPAIAFVFGGGLTLLALGTSILVSLDVFMIVLAYVALMVGYTLWLRQIAVADLLAIAGGFLLRAWSGAVAVSVPLSNWLFLCTLLLALLLGLGKRRHELRMLRHDVGNHRPSLVGYSRLDLDRVILGVACATIVAYGWYAVSIPSFGRSVPMVITVPFVAAGVGRYVYLVIMRNLGGSPEMLLIRDRPTFISIVCWAISVAAVLAS